MWEKQNRLARENIGFFMAEGKVKVMIKLKGTMYVKGTNH